MTHHGRTIIGYSAFNSDGLPVRDFDTLKQADAWRRKRAFPEDYEIKRLVDAETHTAETFILPGASR